MRNMWTRACFVAMVSTVAVFAWSSAVGREGLPRELLRMHDSGVLSFIDSEGFGEMRLPPTNEMLHRKPVGTKLFVLNIELVGIARHNPPKVFSTTSIFHVPNKKHPLRRGTGRSMTAWERQAVRDLDAGQRLVIRKEGEDMRVMGPIHAGDECLGCHKDKRAGDMLGALVYELVPARGVLEEAPAK